MSQSAADSLGYGLSSPTTVDVCDSCGPQPSVDLGSFAAGTSLVFYLTDGVTYSSTDPAHARVTQVSSTQWSIHWDDSGGDMDFNDLVTEITLGPPPTSQTALILDEGLSQTYGSSTDIDANVTSANGSTGTPTGTVTFTDNGNALAGPITLDDTGSTDYVTETLPVGDNVIVATYSGDATHGSSQDGADVHVGYAVTFKYVKAPKKAKIGQAITFKVDLTSSSKKLVPTGSVEFYDQGTLVGSATLKKGAASFKYAFTGAGSDYLEAVYPATGDFDGATSYSNTVTVK